MKHLFYQMDQSNLAGLINGLEEILKDLKSGLSIRQMRSRHKSNFEEEQRKRRGAGERALLYHMRGLSIDDAVELVAKETKIPNWCVAGNMRYAKQRLKTLDKHTRRERAILERLAGRPVCDIAKDLGVSPATIYRDTGIKKGA